MKALVPEAGDILFVRAEERQLLLRGFRVAASPVARRSTNDTACVYRDGAGFRRTRM
jgi:hypothetical protein